MLTFTPTEDNAVIIFNENEETAQYIPIYEIGELWTFIIEKTTRKIHRSRSGFIQIYKYNNKLISKLAGLTLTFNMINNSVLRIWIFDNHVKIRYNGKTKWSQDDIPKLRPSFSADNYEFPDVISKFAENRNLLMQPTIISQDIDEKSTEMNPIEQIDKNATSDNEIGKKKKDHIKYTQLITQCLILTAMAGLIIINGIIASNLTY